MSRDYEHALAKVLDAAAAGDQGPGPMSTGKALMILPRIARVVAEH